MQAREHVTTEIRMTLNDRERVWLKDYMQNPHVGTRLPDKESAEDKEMREKFFNACSNPTRM